VHVHVTVAVAVTVTVTVKFDGGIGSGSICTFQQQQQQRQDHTSRGSNVMIMECHCVVFVQNGASCLVRTTSRRQAILYYYVNEYVCTILKWLHTININMTFSNRTNN
jgi:hypothetical protein